MNWEDEFEKNYIPEPNSGCWIWIGGRSKDRAVFLQTTAARIAWQIYYGDIPHGLDVLHRCDVPMCVNPQHLFVGTHSDNMMDMVAKDRHAKIKPRGEDHGNTKLTDRDFLEIKQLRGHLSTLEISRAYKISRAYVSHIQLGRYQR